MTRRIATLVGLIALLAVVAFGVPTVMAFYRVQEHAIRLELEEEAFIAASSLRPEEPAVVTNVAAVVSSDPHRIALYAMDGTRLSGDGPLVGDAAVRRARSDRIGQSRNEIEEVAAVLIPRLGHNDVVLRVAEDASEVESNTYSHVIPLAAVGVLVVLVAILIGWQLTRQLLRPFNNLMSIAHSVGTASPVRVAPKTGIVELDKLADVLVGSARRVEGTIEREQKFSAHVAHQLRTPISAARLVLEAEIEAPRDDPSIALAEALSAVDQLGRTTTNLLNLSRGFDHNSSPTDLDLIVSDALARWRGQFHAEGKVFSVSLNAAGQRTTAVIALEQILDVLLENALRHGNGPTAVSTTLIDSTTVVVAVADSGTVPSDPFRSSPSGGHGIGLRFALALAEAEAGTLTLQSSNPTRFVLRLPTTPTTESPE